MARAAKLIDAPPAEPVTPETCGNCSGWKAAHMQASVGQCMPNSGLHPLMTTDRQSCSGWKPKA